MDSCRPDPTSFINVIKLLCFLSFRLTSWSEFIRVQKVYMIHKKNVDFTDQTWCEDVLAWIRFAVSRYLLSDATQCNRYVSISMSNLYTVLLNKKYSVFKRCRQKRNKRHHSTSIWPSFDVNKPTCDDVMILTPKVTCLDLGATL